MDNWGTFMTYLILTTFSPGPNTTLATTTGNMHGFRKSLPVVLGMVFGFFIDMLLSGLFTTLFTTLLPKVMPIMRYAGAAYILWLAWVIARSKPKTANENEAEKPASFFTGMFLQFVNVKVILMGLTAFSTFIAPHKPTAFASLGYAVLITGFCFASLVSWAAFGAILQRFFSKYNRMINIVLALLLVYCAIMLFL